MIRRVGRVPRVCPLLSTLNESSEVIQIEWMSEEIGLMPGGVDGLKHDHAPPTLCDRGMCLGGNGGVSGGSPLRTSMTTPPRAAPPDQVEATKLVPKFWHQSRHQGAPVGVRFGIVICALDVLSMYVCAGRDRHLRTQPTSRQRLASASCFCFASNCLPRFCKGL